MHQVCRGDRTTHDTSYGRRRSARSHGHLPPKSRARTALGRIQHTEPRRPRWRPHSTGSAPRACSGSPTQLVDRAHRTHQPLGDLGVAGASAISASTSRLALGQTSRVAARGRLRTARDPLYAERAQPLPYLVRARRIELVEHLQRLQRRFPPEVASSRARSYGSRHSADARRQSPRRAATYTSEQVSNGSTVTPTGTGTGTARRRCARARRDRTLGGEPRMDALGNVLPPAQPGPRRTRSWYRIPISDSCFQARSQEAASSVSAVSRSPRRASSRAGTGTL